MNINNNKLVYGLKYHYLHIDRSPSCPHINKAFITYQNNTTSMVMIDIIAIYLFEGLFIDDLSRSMAPVYLIRMKDG